MTKEEARQIFLSRGFVEVEGGTIYDPDKWREACVVISEWLEQEPTTVIATGDGAYYKIKACEDAISRQSLDVLMAQADGEKTCGTCRNEDTYHCAECENKSDYEQAQADGEYINRQQVMSDYADWYGYDYQNNWFYKHLKNMSSVGIPNKVGHWIWQTEDIYQCSECGEDIHVKEVMNEPQYAWCPICGCPMVIER